MPNIANNRFTKKEEKNTFLGHPKACEDLDLRADLRVPPPALRPDLGLRQPVVVEGTVQDDLVVAAVQPQLLPEPPDDLQPPRDGRLEGAGLPVVRSSFSFTPAKGHSSLHTNRELWLWS